MKKIIGLIVVIAILGLTAVDATAKGGYKEFAWGVSMAEVQKKSPGYEDYSKKARADDYSYKGSDISVAISFMGAYVLQYSDLYPGSMPNPYGLHMAGKVKSLVDKNGGATLFFSDDRLFAAEVSMPYKGALGELASKYGKYEKVEFYFWRLDYKGYVWSGDKERLIVATEMRDDPGLGMSVIYFDHGLYRKIVEETNREVLNERKSIKGRLD